MNRRFFLRLSPTLLTLPSIISCESNSYKNTGNFETHIQSDRQVGHLIFEGAKFPFDKLYKTNILIVGGGIAGMTAATKLKNEDFILAELSENLGGTSSANQFEGDWFGQGAHYDLAYPAYFGKEVLQFLENLKLIEYSQVGGNWIFTDKQYNINPEQEGRTWHNRQMREDVIPDTEEGNNFLKLMHHFEGKVKLPTRLIEAKYHFLNEISLLNYLKKEIKISEKLVQAIDYQMLDDFGGTTAEVSALAGVYYYASRPYHSKEMEVFSPPQGNFYFIQKMQEQVPTEKIWLNHLISKIEKSGDEFLVEMIDAQQKTIKKIQCKKIVYAGTKHALKHIFPADYPLFQKNEYSPWLVLNIVLNEDFLPEGFWQNEIISEKTKLSKHFLGFVDSSTQYQFQKKFRILTAYFCFAPDYRKNLAQSNFDHLIQYALEEINAYFKLGKGRLNSAVEKVFVKIMGHAMPIPQANYLFQDKNKQRSEPNLVYAGVDNSRLPLMLEAMDSGLEAVKLLKL